MASDVALGGRTAPVMAETCPQFHPELIDPLPPLLPAVPPAIDGAAGRADPDHMGAFLP